MAFLNLKKKKTEAVPAAPKAAGKSVSVTSSSLGRIVLVKPHITEKAAFSGERGAYVFKVEEYATKKEIREAIRAMYKVVPVKVAIARIPSKRIMVKGRPGQSVGGKKAYVYLKKGDKIEVV